MPINYGSMPFNKAVEAFQDKLNLPTASWTDIYQGQHARAFVIAGAMKEDLLTDFRKAVDKVIAQGMSLEDFRKNFDQIVAKHGWGYNGGRNWRSRVIYETNLYQSHNAGRYAQMQEVKKTRPFWQYIHNDAVEHPRPEHLSWNGLVLDADDPFWNTHYPQNGWGCKCRVRTLNKRDMAKLGKTAPDTPPELEYEDKIIGIRGPSPRTVRVPKGIDPGFDYNPGKATWGQTLSDSAMSEWKKTKGQWQTLTPQGWAEADRPDRIPMYEIAEHRIDPLNSVDETVSKVKEIIGGDEVLFNTGNVPVLINASTFGKHLVEKADGSKSFERTAYLPFLKDILTDPYEIWQSFEEHQGTGRVVIRSRYIKAYKVGKSRYLHVVADAKKGMLYGWTFFTSSSRNYTNQARYGKLIYAKE